MDKANIENTLIVFNIFFTFIEDKNSPLDKVKYLAINIDQCFYQFMTIWALVIMLW